MVKQLCVLAVLALMTGGCGGGSGAPSLYGSWVFDSPDGVSGAGLNLASDDTYVGLTLTITSSSQNSAAANVESETGTFAVSGSQITFTPKEWTCHEPDPAYVLSYSFDGPNLVISGPGSVVSFAPNGPSSGATEVITYGCFSAGVFTPSALAPVTN
jgi:hypothetical protein